MERTSYFRPAPFSAFRSPLSIYSRRESVTHRAMIVHAQGRTVHNCRGNFGYSGVHEQNCAKGIGTRAAPCADEKKKKKNMGKSLHAVRWIVASEYPKRNRQAEATFEILQYTPYMLAFLISKYSIDVENTNINRSPND